MCGNFQTFWFQNHRFLGFFFPNFQVTPDELSELGVLHWYLPPTGNYPAKAVPWEPKEGIQDTQKVCFFLVGRCRGVDSEVKDTVKGTNISYLGKRKIIFKRALGGDMLVFRRVSGWKMDSFWWRFVGGSENENLRCHSRAAIFLATCKDKELAKIRDSRGYNYADIITCSEAHAGEVFCETLWGLGSLVLFFFGVNGKLNFWGPPRCSGVLARLSQQAESILRGAHSFRWGTSKATHITLASVVHGEISDIRYPITWLFFPKKILSDIQLGHDIFIHFFHGLFFGFQPGSEIHPQRKWLFWCTGSERPMDSHSTECWWPHCAAGRHLSQASRLLVWAKLRMPFISWEKFSSTKDFS